MIPPLVLVGMALLGGAIVGSFLNVVIYRVPRGESVARPRSRCPACSEPVRPSDNIPVISWVLLRGRCRACDDVISSRYVLVESGTALAWAGLAAWALAVPIALPMLPLLLVLTSAGIALGVIDAQHHRLPDVIVLQLYPVLLIGLVLATFLAGSPSEGPAALDALAGGALWLLSVGMIWVLTKGRGMGLGDVKLAPVLGVTLGWLSIGSAVVGLVSAFLLGAVVAAFLLATGRTQRRTAIAFGPFLLLGAAVGLVLGPSVSEAYLRMTGIG